MSEPEAWLRGPLPGVDPYLMPAAHALIQAGEDLEAAASLTEEQLEARPGGVASVGYHLRHLAGSTERLLTYARGRSLTPEQLAVARQEASLAESRDAVSLIAGAREALAAGRPCRPTGQAPCDSRDSCTCARMSGMTEKRKSMAR